MKAADRSRRRLQIFALAVAAFFGALALVTWWTGRDNPREGSKVVAQSGAPLGVGKVAQSYRAVFRVENRAARELNVTTERVWVRRPFQSRIETYRGPPPGQRRLSLRQSAFGILASRSERAEPLNIAAPPSLASGDVRLDPVLEEATSQRIILRRERREVYGRQCQIYRAGGPVFAGDLQRYVPGRGEFADVCIDRNGIVVEEAWTREGRLIQRRVAVEVDVDPPLDRRLFVIDVPSSAKSFRGSVERINTKDSEEPSDLWTLPAPPQGFERIGRYAVALPEAAIPQLSVPGAGFPISSTTDVFVRGPDLIVVDQDPSLAVAVQAESRSPRDVKVPNLRNAELIFDARMSEVRGETPEGSVVRVFGTVAPSELVELARKLRTPS